jgi:tyrosine-protein kinase Etk/Wzc
VLALAALLGLAAGLTAALAGKSFRRGAGDAEEVEHGTGLTVVASIPHSKSQTALTRAFDRGSNATLPILSTFDPADAAIENLRALRTSLQLTLAGNRTNVLAILGPSPGVGKSFVCVNLAHVLAAAERRVLLVDGDLRRGRLHEFFEVARQPGLSEVVSGTASLGDAVVRADQIDLLPAGSIPSNPAELLARPSFERFLEEASRRYDLVVVDTPPILAVADPLIIASLAGMNLLVLRARRDPLREVALAIKRLARSGVQVQGAVLNDVRSARDSSAMYGRYGKQALKPKLEV